MASTEGPSFDRSAPVSMDRSRMRSRRDVWFPSEFVVFVLYVMGLGVSASTDATIDSRLFWILTTVATAAYMLSRGIAKAATRSRAYDPREDIDLGKD
jgi:hypothetical protein